MDDLAGSVVAIIDGRGQARRAVSELESAGHPEVTLLHGPASTLEDDDPDFGDMFKRLLEVFGDEARIRDRLDEALAGGATVLSVVVDSEEAEEVSRILESFGGRDMWRLGEWSHNRVGGQGVGEG